MAAIGSEEYPEYTLTECLHWVEKVKRDKVQTFDTLVGVLGHENPKSSGVGLKMASLGKYWGLLTKDGKAVRLTPLAEQLVYDLGDTARADALREVIGRVKLLPKLYSKLGPDYNPRDFNPVLHEVSGAKPEEVEEKASRVERLYKDSVQYFAGRSTKLAAAPPAGRHQRSEVGSEGLTPSQVPPLQTPVEAEQYHVYQTGENYVRLRKDVEVLEVAKGVIEVWLARMKVKGGKQPSDGEQGKDG